MQSKQIIIKINAYHNESVNLKIQYLYNTNVSNFIKLEYAALIYSLLKYICQAPLFICNYYSKSSVAADPEVSKIFIELSFWFERVPVINPSLDSEALLPNSCILIINIANT